MPRLDRNARARLLFHAEALDRRTHLPGQHGGVLKRTGLAVLRALLFGFANVATGRCDPSFDTLARAAGVAHSTVAAALHRLEAAGLVERIRRQVGMTRFSNAYRFPAAEVVLNFSETGKSEFRAQTTTNQKPKSYRELSTDAGPTAWHGLCDETPAEARAFARVTIEAIRRTRAARQAQQAAS
jgi:DNA-binding transcriptional MocR family regulator